MSKVIRLDSRRKAGEDSPNGEKQEAEILGFNVKKLVFDLKSIPPADRVRTCNFCQDRAARWYSVSQNNIMLFFDENIQFCLDPKCARLARKEITRIAPFPNLLATMQKIKNLPAVMKNYFFPDKKPDQDDPK